MVDHREYWANNRISVFEIILDMPSVKQGKTHTPRAENRIKRAKKRQKRQKEEKKSREWLKKEDKEQNENRELANLRRKVQLLECSLALSRQKTRPEKSTTHHNRTVVHGTRKHKSNRIEAKRAVNNHLVSLPAMLRQESFSVVLETEYRGTFGSIAVARLTFVNDLVAIKRVSMDFSENVDIMAEVRTMHALKGRHLFPHCFGYVLPNLIVFQLLGRYENGTLTVQTVDKLNDAGNDNLCHISYQIVEGISYLHELGLLHNDIKGNNIIIHKS